MPEWITPELCPLCCVPSLTFFSTIASFICGNRSNNFIAVDRPIIPAPMTTTSYLVELK